MFDKPTLNKAMDTACHDKEHALKVMLLFDED